MRIFALFFAVGVCLLQVQAELSPQTRALAAVALLLALAGGVLPRFALRGGARRFAGWSALLIAAAATGFGWASLRAEWRLADALHTALEGEDLLLRGRIVDLPRSTESALRFLFEVDPPHVGVPARLQLSWYRPRQATASATELPHLRPGDGWLLPVRLTRPRGAANPGGLAGSFDYAAWLLQKGVRATGHVRGEPQRLEVGAPGAMQRVHRLRGQVRQRFLAVLDGAPYAGMLVALAVGDQQAIPPAQWDSFRRTGIAHLVSISGLHVALVASLAAGVAGALWRRVPPLVLRLPVRKLQAVAALVAGSGYALLAGMGIPVLRALLMLAVVALAVLGGRQAAPSRVLALALLVVLLFDPWAVLAPGFWLSFGAVGVILHVIGGRARSLSGWKAALRIQLAISLALVPLLVLFFQSVPLLSPLANALAIPLVSFVVTPLTLTAVLLPFDFLLHWAHALTAAMMWPIEELARIDAAFWQQAAAPTWLGVAAGLALALLILPRATPGKPAALVVLIALLGWQAPRPPSGGFRLQVLDVGQGLAVHVQTARHDLLYDAGPTFGRHGDAGERLLLPYLRTQGVRELDLQVLSHEDSDHVGGARSVLAAMPVQAIVTPAGSGAFLPASARARLQACAAGQRWQWDEVWFEFLHPASPLGERPPRRAGNEASCVLQVRAASGSALLTGDIGTTTEATLLAVHGKEALASTVVVSAHHGSRSSSSPAFVDAVMAEAVIHSAGYRNAFGHPHPEVWARWAWAGARNWRTDGQGAVEAVFAPAPEAGVRLRAERERRPRYWHGR